MALIVALFGDYNMLPVYRIICFISSLKWFFVVGLPSEHDLVGCACYYYFDCMCLEPEDDSVSSPSLNFTYSFAFVSHAASI